MIFWTIHGLRIKNWTSQTILILWTKTFCTWWKVTIAHFLSKILLQAMVTWLCSFDFSNSRPCLLYTEAMLPGKEWLLLGMKYPTLMFTKHLLICAIYWLSFQQWWWRMELYIAILICEWLGHLIIGNEMSSFDHL